MIQLMTHKITLLPGDGIGPEVANAATQIVEASGVSVEWEIFAAPLQDGQRVGEFPREDAVESVRRTHVALKGPMATAVAQGPPSINVALRKELDLYANLRPVRNVTGVSSPLVRRGLGNRARKYRGFVRRAGTYGDSRCRGKPENHH